MRKLTFTSSRGLDLPLVLLVLAALPAGAQIPPTISPTSVGPTMQGRFESIVFSVPALPNNCFNWSLAGTPPPGMSLTNATASPTSTYQGTATTPNATPYSFEIFAVATACAVGGPPAALTLIQPLSHLIYPALDISPLTAASGTVGVFYSQTFSQVGGVGPGGISLNGGSVPPGLTLSFPGSSAILSGTPTTAGTYSFSLIVFDPNEDSRTRDYTVVISPAGQPLTFLTGATLPGATTGVAYSVMLQTTGGVPPVSGPPGQNPAMPPGLAFNNSTLTISGTPTAAGTYSIPVTARDIQGNTTSRTFSLTIATAFRIITLSLPDSVVGQPYNALIQTEGAPPPITFSYTGTLPPGLGLNAANGLISGISTSIGKFQFSVTATSGNRVTPAVTYVVNIVQPALDFSPDVLPNGSVGRTYQSQFRPTGGNGQYRFSSAPGSTLPPGLSLSTSGVVSGTPTTEGLFRFVVSLTSGEENIEKLVRITIDPPALAITPDALPEGTRGIAYQAAFGASGGTAPYTFRTSGGQLPAGLALSAAGALTGTPTAIGASKFTVQVIDARERTGMREYELTIREELRITTESLPSGAQGEAYTGLVEAAGGVSPYAFTVAAGSLPPGVTLASDGRLSGTPTQGGRFTATIQAADRSNRTARREFAITIGAALRLLPDSLPGGMVGRAYTASLSAEGGQAPYTFAVTGALPAGIAFANGAFTGAPTQAGQFNITGQVTDARNRVVNRQYTITIAPPPALTVSGNPGPGTVGAPYRAEFSATGGTAPYSFSAANPPPGLSVSSDGVMSGTPTASGAFSFAVSATAAFGAQGSATFQITVGLPPTPPPSISIANPNVSANQQTPITLTFTTPYPLPITGFLELTFVPVRGGDDPAIQFSNGSRRLNFTIPAGATAAVFTPAQAALQTGTVAGTITLLATLQSGGSDITPTPRPSSQIRIPPGPPVITRVEVNRTATGSDLIVFCYATSREITQGVLRLTARSGVTLSQTEFTIPLSAIFTTWYASDQSIPFGSQARLVIPLTNVNTEAVESLTIQLTNAVGSSENVRFTF